MSYTAPAITATGFTRPSFDDIRNFLIQNFQTVYGNSVYLGNDSADIQMIGIFALLASDAMAALQQEYLNRSVNFATGAALDSLAALIGPKRKVATFSTVQIAVVGTPGTVITDGIVLDTLPVPNRWDLPASVTIPGGGTITVTATCETAGAVTVPAYSGPGTGVSIIGTATSGWTSATNAAPSVPGQPVESDSQYRTRLFLSNALPSQTILAGTIAELEATPGVTRLNVDENFTNATNANGNPPHSITAIVEGGDNLAVATAIFENRGLGVLTNGSIPITVTDPETGGTTVISFSRPTYVTIYVVLNAHLLAGGTSATLLNMANALTTYLNSLQIGESVLYSALIAICMSVNPNLSIPIVLVQSLTFGTAPAPSGTTDIPLLFNQVALGIFANIVLNSV